MASAGMIAVALYKEHYLGLKPCILCYMQRGSVIIVGILAAFGMIINPKKILTYKIILSSIFISILSGALLSIRQLYLQSLPADMEYLFATLPFLEILILAFTGDGNCAEILWTFMGISIPGWVLISLSFLLIYCVFIFKKVNEIHSHN